MVKALRHVLSRLARCNTLLVNALPGAYEAWKREPFPSGGSDDEVDELHADLALADSWVAESVIPYVEHGRFVPAQTDVLGELRIMRDRAAALGDAHAAGAYIRYIDLLANAYEAFLKESDDTGPSLPS